MTLIRHRHHRWVILVAALVGVAGTARLGLWQLDRAAQKIDRQTLLDERQKLPELTAADLARQPEEVDGQIQRLVRLQGRWVARATLFLDNRPMDGRVGFHVVTPLQLADGTAVLVERGWAPRNALRREDLPPVKTPDAEAVTVVARIIPTPSRLFDFGGLESGPIRQNLDIAAAARESGLSLRPVALLQTEGPTDDGLLRHWSAPSTGVDKHHGYAAQWFALSALIAGLYVWFQLIRPRRLAASHVE
ncbi:SURF1 family protein [uncultured Sphaerotilus sp.]|uniref:SURF1 family protein n=1 Tax=uncultured Sphaerotilus sp. TaxID=474984 RepID=UPI0030CA3C28